MKRTNTTHYIEHEGKEFVVPFEVIDGSEIVTIKGDKAIVSYLSPDSDCEDPFEMIEGTFVQFNYNYIHSDRKPDIEAFKRLIREYPNRVFTIDFKDYGCNGSDYSVADGPFSVKDTKGERRTGDKSKAEEALDFADGYYVVPEDVPEDIRLSYAEGVMQNYTDWANGNCYGIVHCEFIRVEDKWVMKDDEEAVWCYIGDYAEKEMKKEHESLIDKLNLF